MLFIRTAGFLAILASSLTASPVIATAPDAPTNAHVVDSFTQLGIDSAAPHFGWVVNDTNRGEWQSAYQIIVSPNKADINDNVGSAWDSGKVASSQQYAIAYAGTPLAKTTEYFWKVRTWDSQGQVSPWSTAASFVTAFFQLSDWQPGIQWIKHPLATAGGTGSNDPPAIFRKEFQVSKPVKQAYLYLCGLGQFVSYLNGVKVGDHVMDPAWSDYDKTVYYVTFDVSSQIQQGGNAIGVMLGNGWFAFPGTRNFGPMTVWGQLRLDFTDGTSTNIVTDLSWKARTSPCTHSKVHGSEDYDARLEPVGWTFAGFDSSSWSNAVAASVPAGSLASQNAPPVKDRQAFQPANITSPAANDQVYDFGQNMNGQYQITVSGTCGMTVHIVAGEYLNGDGHVNPGRSEPSNYTLNGGGTETWRQLFNASGFRYVELTAVTTNAANKSLPLVQNVTAYFVASAAREVGSFNASDQRYNQIHDLALHTLESNLGSIHTDGPNFEHLGWQEVVWTTMPSTAYYHDGSTLWAKIMRDARDAQRTSGLCPDIAPNWFFTTTTPSQNAYDDSPAWGASIFGTPWFVYQTYGDKKILQDNYLAMSNYLAYLKTKEVNGVINYGLGDWMAPAGTAVGNVEGAIYVMDTRLLRDIAGVLGKSSDAALYSAEFERVRSNYNDAYFDSANGRYMPVSQANLVLPLEFGIVPVGCEAEVANALVKDIAQPAESTVGDFGAVQANHVTTGDIATTFLWRALGDYDQPDLVQTMIMQPSLPSYLSLLNAGETTITENWKYPSTRSHNHDMYAGIFEWLYRSLGGISPLQPGYAQIQLKPEMPAGLTNLTCSYDSIRGLISSAWNRSSANTVRWSICIPANATAKVYLPTFGTVPNTINVSENGATIVKNGAVVRNVTGVTYDHVERSNLQTYMVFDVGSGKYEFAWNIRPTLNGLTGSTASQQVSN